MEGVTDDPYRSTIFKLFDEWDYYFTDFYRIPTVGKPSSKSIFKHIGANTLKNESILNKTCFQVLTSARAQNLEAIEIINNIGIKHLDLNLGCPSKKVNAHHGGAYLLQDLKELSKILKEIRDNFDEVFTVKIRTGYRNTDQFLDSIKLFEDSGVDAITIHARTRDQLYQGSADWSFIRQAIESTNLPIIGNGDIWDVHDVQSIFEDYKPYAIMLGRGALKTPWLATQYYQYKDNLDFISSEYLLRERAMYISDYFKTLEQEYSSSGLPSESILKRFKSFSRYLFDDYSNAETLKSKFLRSRSLSEFKGFLETL